MPLQIIRRIHEEKFLSFSGQNSAKCCGTTHSGWRCAPGNQHCAFSIFSPYKLIRHCVPRTWCYKPGKVLRPCPTPTTSLPSVLCPWPRHCALGQEGPPSKLTLQIKSIASKSLPRVLQALLRGSWIP